jgi:hypothetical protein
VTNVEHPTLTELLGKNVGGDQSAVVVFDTQ